MTSNVSSPMRNAAVVSNRSGLTAAVGVDRMAAVGACGRGPPLQRLPVAREALRLVTIRASWRVPPTRSMRTLASLAADQQGFPVAEHACGSVVVHQPK